MKKIISLILAFVMSMSVCNFALAEQENVPPLTQAIDLLTSLGVLDSSFEDYDSDAKRGFTVSVAAKLISANITSEYNNKYIDIKESTQYMQEIMFMSSMGYVDGYDNGMFMPDNAITYAEFSKMIIKMLGYDVNAQFYGNYPQGYLKAMDELEISISGKGSESKITNGEMLISLYDTLMVVTRGLVSVEGNIINIGDKDSLLEQRDVFQIKGVVSQVCGTSIEYGTEELRRDEIKIGDYVVKVNIDNPIEYLGKTVTAYVREIKEDSEYELLSVIRVSYEEEYIITPDDDMTWNRNSNNVLVIKYAVGNKSKTLNIPSDAKYYYNGRLTADYDLIEQGLNTTQGNVRVLKTQNGTYIFLNEYFDIVVSAIDEENCFLSDTLVYGKIEIPVKDEYVYVGIHTDEGKIDFGGIKTGDVLSIFKSIDSKHFDIYVHREKVSGVVSRIRDSKYIVDGVEYELNAGIVQGITNRKKTFGEIKLNDNVTFYLNKYGKVADVDITRNDLTYAYMFKPIYVTEDNEAEFGNYVAGFKLYNVELGKNLTYFATEKLKVNGVRCKTAAKATAELQSLITAWGKTEMLVKVKYSGDNEITDIEIPVRNSNNYDRLRWIANYDNLRTPEITRISGKYLYDSNTTILKVYEGKEKVIKETVKYGSSDQYWNYEVYDADELDYVSALVLRMEGDFTTQSNSDIYYGHPVWIVDSINEEWIEEEAEAVLAINAYNNGAGTLSKLITSNEQVNNVDTDIDTKFFGTQCYNIPTVNGIRYGNYGYSYLTIDELKRGDVIQVDYDINGRVDRFRVLARLDDQLDNGYFEALMAGSDNLIPYSLLTYGRISYMNERGFVLDYTNNSRTFLTKTVPVLIYSKGSNSFSVGSMTDITEGAKVIVRALKLTPSFIIVVED